MSEDEPRAWLIGESPSRTGDRYWRFPLSGAPAKTLCQCADFPPDGDGKHLRDWSWALYSRFRTVNLFQRHAEATPWSTLAARERGRDRLERLVAWDASCAVLLGRRVGGAFGLDTRPYFEWTTAGLPLVVIPHPSGRNLLMNDAKVREWVGKTLRAAAER
jgi:hypothetical protein